MAYLMQLIFWNDYSLLAHWIEDLWDGSAMAMAIATAPTLDHLSLHTLHR